MSYQDTKTHRKTTRLRIIKSMGGECQLCGYKKCIRALEIHHINPEEKEFTFSTDKLCHSWEKLSEELKKCILLCANCHREVHDDMLNFELKTSFNECFSDEIQDNINEIKNKTHIFCLDCGKEISLGSERCVECSLFKRRKSERPGKKELKEKIREQSFLAIGREYNVSDTAIRKWCDTYGLPRTKYEINNISQENWDKDNFLVEKQEEEIKAEKIKYLIGKYDLNNNLINQYQTIADAARDLIKEKNLICSFESASSSIGRVIGGYRNSYQNYYWKKDF